MLNFLLSFDDYILQITFSFLNIRDRIKCEKVSSSFRERISHSYLWKCIDAELTKPYNLFEKSWLLRKLQANRDIIQELILDDMHEQWNLSDFESIFSFPSSMPNMHILSLSSFNLTNQQKAALSAMIVKSCKNLRTFRTHGNFLDDERMLEFKELKNLENLSILSNYEGFYGTSLKECQPLKSVRRQSKIKHFLKLFFILIKLILRAYSVEFESIKDTLMKSNGNIEQLAIDIEYFDDSQLLELFACLDKSKVTKIILNQCEGMGDQAFRYLAEFSNLTHLKAYKTLNVSEFCIKQCFSNFKSCSLVMLNLKECVELNDESLECIVERNPQLQEIKLDWNGFISSRSVRFILRKVKNIKHLSLIGVKAVDQYAFDGVFQLLPYFNKDKYCELQRSAQLRDAYGQETLDNRLYEKIDVKSFFKIPSLEISANSMIHCAEEPFNTSSVSSEEDQRLSQQKEQQLLLSTLLDNLLQIPYQNLKLLDCQKVDRLPDETLMILHLILPYITARNYYGVSM